LARKRSHQVRALGVGDEMRIEVVGGAAWRAACHLLPQSIQRRQSYPGRLHSDSGLSPEKWKVVSSFHRHHFVSTVTAAVAVLVAIVLMTCSLRTIPAGDGIPLYPSAGIGGRVG